LLLRPAYVDLPSSRDRGNKWRPGSATDSLHLAEGDFESDSHLFSRHITGCEYKLTHDILLKSPLFKKIVADTLVGSEQDPPIIAYEWKPGFIGRTPAKVFEVALEVNFQSCQGF
jgi:hypothetical protein